MHSSTPDVIYDFGSNNGSDLPYYLKKARRVIAVEANSELCEQIKQSFSQEIERGHLFVENCVLNVDENVAATTFYIHKIHHTMSQFPRPTEENIIDFHQISVRALSPRRLIEKYGPPIYIKIDLEHYDAEVLYHLFINSIRPPYISAESHSARVFCILVALGGYNAFKLVDGSSVADKYINYDILNRYGVTEKYSFPYNSAGPFGVDIDGDWMTADNFLRVLAMEQMGWKDIHATNVKDGNPACYLRLRDVLYRESVRVLQNKLRLGA